LLRGSPLEFITILLWFEKDVYVLVEGISIGVYKKASSEPSRGIGIVEDYSVGVYNNHVSAAVTKSSMLEITPLEFTTFLKNNLLTLW
jgi:hypothetical protein